MGNLAFFYDTFFPRSNSAPQPVHFAYGMRQVPSTPPPLSPAPFVRPGCTIPHRHYRRRRLTLCANYEYVYCIARRPPDAARGKLATCVGEARHVVSRRVSVATEPAGRLILERARSVLFNGVERGEESEYYNGVERCESTCGRS